MPTGILCDRKDCAWNNEYEECGSLVPVELLVPPESEDRDRLLVCETYKPKESEDKKMNVENYFNKAVKELNKEFEKDTDKETIIERGMFKQDELMLVAILRTRREKFQGWINRMEFENDKMNVHDITEQDIIENMKYIILDDLLALQGNKTKQIGW